MSTKISDQTEAEMIESILQIYSADKKACHEIAKHIAEKLTQRRKLIREQRAS